MNNPKILATRHIPGLLAFFAVPSILSLILHAFYHVADRIFIGRGVGALGLAGVTLCFPILLMLFGVCILFSSGVSALISIYLGQNRHDEAEKALGSTIFVITILGALLAIFGQLYHKNIINLFNVPSEILPYAEGYLRIILSGAPLFFYGFTLTFVIRSEGNPIYATLAIVVGTIINLILDPIFIFVFSMGTEGAALATIIAESTVALMGLLYMTRKKGVIHVRRKNLILNFKILGKTMSLGLSSAIMNIAGSIQCLFLNERLLIYGGGIAVATMGIIFPIFSMIRLFTFGMAAGMQPIVGYNYGANQYKRVKDVFYYACKINFLIVCLFTILIFIFAGKIVALFSKNDLALIALGTHAMRIFFLAAPLAVINILGARYFQSVGKGLKSVIIGLSGQLIIFIPMLFALSLFYKLDGIWASGPLTTTLALIVTVIFLAKEMKFLSSDKITKNNL